MDSFNKDLFLLIIILMMSVKAFLQTYPVSASVQQSPPYSIYLTDCVAPDSEHLKLHLLLKDLNQPFYDARLHMRIECNYRRLAKKY